MIRSLYRAVLPRFIREPIRMWRYEREFHADAEVEYYGAYRQLCAHLKVPGVPYPLRKRINWQHGWVPDHLQEGSSDPFITVQHLKWDDPDRFNLVARKSEEKRLHDFGVPNAMAVGLPIVYTPKRVFSRMKGSLLVMPGHSLDYISQQTREEEYVNFLDSIRNDFTSVTVCVHPSCERNGYWIKTFRSRGYRTVTGAEIKDMDSFSLLQRYFSEHEFCTTNTTGSHVIYASLFGCKVSVIGPEPILSLEDLENSMNWSGSSDKSGLLHTYDRMAVSIFKMHYPQFFVEHPRAAGRNVDLAIYECGHDNRMTPSQFREVVNWISRNPMTPGE
jgi:hypothetical protein